MTNAQRFQDAYRTNMLRRMQTHPEEYALVSNIALEEQARERAAKIVRALAAGQSVNMTTTLRQTAKQLKLADTKQATIMAFIQGK